MVETRWILTTAYLWRDDHATSISASGMCRGQELWFKSLKESFTYMHIDYSRAIIEKLTWLHILKI